MNKARNRGFTILETLIALSIVAIGVVGTLTLSSQTVVGSRASQNEVTATNLAREGIEVARALRDSNWLSIEAGMLQDSEWDNGLYAIGNDYTARAVFDGRRWTLDYQYGDLASCKENCRLYLDETTGVYSHESNGTKTIFHRAVETNAICEDHAIKASGNVCGNKKVGIQVLATVEWEEQNHTSSLTLEERLYNWRQ